MRTRPYPFSALVGQEPMKAALLLNAVDPGIGGVLVRGPKGTGKSTAARSLAALLPPITVVAGCPFNTDPAGTPWTPMLPVAGSQRQPGKTDTRPMPFVELPLNATEDRVTGALQLERALQTGQRCFEPGLLAAAHRGVLYVDEVNLLDDHLVDLLLDAAASGVNVVEREGISFAHPARFLLIGTMNPEEGELRPQFLDRFGLCVTAGQISDLPEREEVIRRRLAFDQDPTAMREVWRAAEEVLAEQICRARQLLSQVRIPEAIIAQAAGLGHRLGAQGHRADLTVVKAARAHAAFLEKSEVEPCDLAAAARLALPHRVPASPLDTPEMIMGRIEQGLLSAGRADPAADGAGSEKAELAATPATGEDMDEWAEQMQVPGVFAAGSIMFSFLKKKTAKLSMRPTSA